MKGGFTSSFQQAAHKKLCEQPFKNGLQEQFFSEFFKFTYTVFAKFALFLVKTRSYSFSYTRTGDESPNHPFYLPTEKLNKSYSAYLLFGYLCGLVVPELLRVP